MQDTLEELKLAAHLILDSSPGDFKMEYSDITDEMIRVKCLMYCTSVLFGQRGLEIVIVRIISLLLWLLSRKSKCHS